MVSIPSSIAHVDALIISWPLQEGPGLPLPLPLRGSLVSMWDMFVVGVEKVAVRM